jgi:hypothetical protein
MKRIPWSFLFHLGCAAAAALFLGVSLFASQLGIDPSPGWGPHRIRLLVLGVAFAAAASWPFWRGPVERFLQIVRQWAQAAGRKLLASPVVQWLLRPVEFLRVRWEAPRVLASRRRIGGRISRVAAWLSSRRVSQFLLGTPERAARTAAWSACVLICILYLWFVSVGRWTDWPRTGAYYDMLADAFAHGQIHLLREPEAGLLQLDNPYDFGQRKGLKYMWDASLYDGHYYLYWGPVPAFFLMPFVGAAEEPIQDNVLVLCLMMATILVTTKLTLTVWEHFYPRHPCWSPLPVVLVAGIANPMAWITNRPEVYEAAIASGQFFLISGVYLAFTGLRSQPLRHARLALAGASLAAAVGSRSSLAFGVGAFALAVVVWLLLQSRLETASGWQVRGLLSFALPFLLGAGLLALYNYVRFDSIFEFGHRYQLGRWNKVGQYQRVFSGLYVIFNLYNYLLNPFRRLPVFPYVKPDWGRHAIWFLRLKAPALYHTEQVVGLLNTTPFALLAGLPIATTLFGRGRTANSLATDARPNAGPRGDALYRWFALALAATLLFTLLPLLVLVANTNRHLGDLLPLLTLLAGMGMWEATSRLASHVTRRRAFALLAWVLAAVSVCYGFLLAITSYLARFEHANPILFDKLTRFFTP